MSVMAHAQAVTDTMPCWYGKLPGSGDFAHRRMPECLQVRWDAWLDEGFAVLRSSHPAWIERYLTAPVWGFALGNEVAGPGGWIGAMAPSVDRVGRYFPITVFEPVAQWGSNGWDWRRASAWWQRAHGVLVQALEVDADARRFDSLVAKELDGDFRTEVVESDCVSWGPAEGQSLWYPAPHAETQGGTVLSGLPTGADFDRLFDAHDGDRVEEEP